MDKSLKEKLRSLEGYFIDLQKVAVAFSGGVDSSFLLKTARNVLGSQVTAFTINTVYIADREIEEATRFTGKHDIAHQIINVPLIDIIQHNPNDRCYFCKTFIFKKMAQEAEALGIQYIVEGTNADDVDAWRPGIKALKELGIKSPLMELGFTKQNIRDLSKNMGLSTWNKPAYACLLTRLPYGTQVTSKELQMVHDAEVYMFSLGFDGVRVRSHGNLARIEVLPEDMHKILNQKTLDKIAKKIKEIGYEFVTLDTEGYKQGSFDHVKH